MSLLVVTIETSHEAEEALTEFLKTDLGALGIESRSRTELLKKSDAKADLTENALKKIPEDLELTAYFSPKTRVETIDDALKAKFEQLKTFHLRTGSQRIKTSFLADQDWQLNWEKYYHQNLFSRHLATVPKWETFRPAFPDQISIKLNPKLSFGTGDHVTTQLALLLLEKTMSKPLTVIDVGTGSGILAIAAAKLGAPKVMATDVAEEAIRASHENIRLNQVSQIELKKTSLLDDIEGKFDLVMANMLAEFLIPLIPQLHDHLNEQGHVILSGIDQKQLPRLESVLKKHHFMVELMMKQSHWIALLITPVHD